MTARLLVLALAAVAALLCASCGTAPEALDYRLEKASRGQFETIIRIEGDLEPRKQYEISAPISAVVTTIVPEGSLVKKGEVVARLDTTADQIDLDAKVAERDGKLIELELQKIELDGELFELSNRHTFGELDLQVLQITERLLRTGVDAGEVVRTALAARNAALVATNLDAAIKEKTPYAAKGFVSKDEMEDQKLKFFQQQVQEKVQKLSHNLLLQGAGPAKVADARKDVALSESAIALVKEKLATFDRRRKATEDELGARIKGLDQEIAMRRSTLAKAVVTSPVDGTMIYVPFNFQGPDEIKVRQGTQVERGVTFAKLAASGRVEVRMQVPERDALRVQPGHAVRVRPSTAPDRVFSGKVREVRSVLSATGFARWLYPQVFSLRVDANVEGQDPVLAPGSTALVEVVLGSRPAVLTVPSAALVRPDQVRMANGEWRKVRTGESSYERTEILEGLTEGESVRVPIFTIAPPEGSRPVQARMGDLEMTVEDSGALEPKVVRDIFTEDSEVDTKIAWLAQEGTSVATGEVVAKLEEQPFRDKLLEQKLELDAAKKDSLTQQEKTSSEVSTLRQQLEVARQDLEIAKIDLELLRQWKTPREKADLKADLDLARKNMEAAQRQLSIKQEMATRGFASRTEIKDLTEKLGEAKAAFEVARVKVELAEKGASELDRRKAEVQVEKARLSVTLSERKLTAGRRKRELTLKKAQLVEKTTQVQVDRLQRLLNNAIVKAPTSGAVVLQERWSNEGLVKSKPGDTVEGGFPFMRIANLSAFEVVGTVPEARVRYIRPGQAAVFWLSSNPGERFPATVAHVAPFAITKEDRRWSLIRRQDRVFEIKLETKASSRRFQPGVSTSFRIVTERVPGTVLVPASAVYADWQGSFVFDSSGRRRDIKAGLNTDTDLSVLSGLAAGEWILGASSDTN